MSVKQLKYLHTQNDFIYSLLLDTRVGFSQQIGVNFQIVNRSFDAEEQSDEYRR